MTELAVMHFWRLTSTELRALTLGDFNDMVKFQSDYIKRMSE